MLGVGFLVITRGKWVSPGAAACVWLPFLAVLAVVLYFSIR